MRLISFLPLLLVARVRASAFATFTHQAFPEYGIRVKLFLENTTGFCDPAVRSYAGYVDIQARHLFFYYFESRSAPESDDVLLWFNGGPGGASSLGLFMELGPCTVTSENTTEINPYSWNSKANTLFIEQPVGVGFSYAEYGQSIDTTEAAANDIAAFLAIFFESMDGLKGRRLHIAGESYGGRYVPLFASQIFDNNQRATQLGITPINLISAIVGKSIDLLTSLCCPNKTQEMAVAIFFSYTITSYYDMQCGITSPNVRPIQTISNCVQMKTILPRCKKAIQAHCIDTFDIINCMAAESFCGEALMTPFTLTGKSMYDMRTECIGEVTDTLCYPITKKIAAYLNSSPIRSILGVPLAPALPNITMANMTVNALFSASGDVHQTSTGHLAALLDHGVQVLLYAGSSDFICNYVGIERLARGLEWSGQEEFAAEPLRELLVDGVAVGEMREFHGLTFASVWNAGHMVPHDKPAEALALINRWLADGRLSGTRK
ncbi:Carboxypeptidase [Mycena indigotica]|uniref:Carboxypeptidase n=1 Tax=Mycena indigotica TaxID=2126181 RepID=A0A8H6VY67_9AGAR|nr:Carboxypeptidase [Mycena indigotica]KAF7294558.1 Carboxypeptidase [Mycena indigotica]